jgi:SAM-dependent methyltransferase
MDDALEHLARYYDTIMGHVNYDRWFMTTTTLSALLPQDLRHLDVACGTAVLVKRLRRAGWDSMGVDLSLAMLQAGRKPETLLPLAAADMRALPFQNQFHFITCLFDSLNFLLTEDDLRCALGGFADCLKEDSLIYFDIVTERMVTQHFDGQSWTENNGRFATTWSSAYEPETGTTDTRVRVNTGQEALVRERIYSQELLERVVADAGLELLGVFDADNWEKPRRRSTRLDFVAAKAPGPRLKQRFDTVCRTVQKMLQ